MLIQRLKAIESLIGDTNLMDLTTEWTKKRKKEQEEESSEGKFPNDSKKNHQWHTLVCNCNRANQFKIWEQQLTSLAIL